MNLRVRADLSFNPAGDFDPRLGRESPAIFMQEILMKRKYEKRDLYKEVTQRFVDALKNGAPPWIKPWSDSISNAGRPTNAATGRKYSGINISILWTAAAAAGYTRDRWLTYNQATEVGGHVCRGQKGIVAILYRDYDVQRKDATGAAVLDENGRPMTDTIKLIKGFPLFNVEQCDGSAKRDCRRPRPPAFTTGVESASSR